MTKDRHLTYEDRCQIHALLRRGISQTEIARDIAVHRSTISRELRRNAGKTGYYYHWAQEKAEERQRKRYSRLRKMTPAVVAFIEGRLTEGWKPHGRDPQSRTRDLKGLGSRQPDRQGRTRQA